MEIFFVMSSGVIAAIILLWGWITILLLRRYHYIQGMFMLRDHQWEKRRDTIPLLISLMQGYVIRSEEVFRKIKALHSQLLSFSDQHTQEIVTKELSFIQTVAEQHTSIRDDKRLRQIMLELTTMEENLRDITQRINKEQELFVKLKRKSIWCLYPGFFLIANQTD